MKTLFRSICLVLALAAAGAALATVPSTTSRQDLLGDGSTLPFTFTFKVYDKADVEVFVNGAKQTSGFTTSLNANQDTTPGGTVTFLSAPASQAPVRIQRTVPLTQGLALNPSTYPAKSIEKTHDREVMALQQIKRAVDDYVAEAAAAAAAPGNSTPIVALGSSTARTLAARFGDVVNVRDFGATGDGITDDTAAIQAAVDSLGSAGGTVFAPAGTYKLTSAITIKSGVRLTGAGYGASNQAPTGATEFKSSTSDLFANGSATVTGAVFDTFTARSYAGGGHIFNLSGSGAVTNSEWRNVVLIQNNAGKAVVQATGAGGAFVIRMHDFAFQYPASNSVPALNFSNTAVSHVAIERFWAQGPNVTAGTYAIRIEGVTTHATNCTIRDGVLEQTRAGGVDLLSVQDSFVDGLRIWDIPGVDALSNPLVHVGKSASNTGGSARIGFSNLHLTGGTAGIPDVQLDPAGGGGSYAIRDSYVLWLDGVSGGLHAITSSNSYLPNTENITVGTLANTTNDATVLGGITTNAASGSVGLSLLQGARLSLSGGGSPYFAFDGSNVVLTGASLVVGASGTGNVDAATLDGAYGSTAATVRGGLADGATAVGVILDQSAAFTTAGAKLVSIRSATTEKAAIRTNGTAWGLRLQSPDGTWYLLTIANGGTVTVSANP